jgi:hypothetical protein
MGFAALFTVEAIIKVIADGFWRTPNIWFPGADDSGGTREYGHIPGLAGPMAPRQSPRTSGISRICTGYLVLWTNWLDVPAGDTCSRSDVSCLGLYGHQLARMTALSSASVPPGLADQHGGRPRYRPRPPGSVQPPLPNQPLPWQVNPQPNWSAPTTTNTAPALGAQPNLTAVVAASTGAGRRRRAEACRQQRADILRRLRRPR